MNKTFLAMILMALILHMIACVYSVGFYHPDEHYQIVEFAAYKVGLVQQQDLAWEYFSRSRPWIQPFLMSVVFRMLMSIGVHNVFVSLLVLRIIISLLSIISFILLGLCTLKWIPNKRIRNITLFALLFAFYIPVLHARLSSENFSAFFIITTIGILSLSKPSSLSGNSIKSFLIRFFVGSMLGMAFVVRYQMIFMVIGIFAWLMVVKKIKLRHFLEISSAFIFIFFISIYADHWGYGVWTLSIWNQFKIMFITKNYPSNQSYPWWFYSVMYWREFSGPLGLTLLIFPLLLWCLAPYQILTFATIPFILFHFFIPHKEVRYLFPYIYLAPIMIGVSMWELLKRKCLKFLYQKTIRGILYGLVFVLLIINAGLLVVNMLVPQTDNVFFLQAIHDHVPIGNNIYWESNTNPFTLDGLPLMFFYSSQYFPVQVGSFKGLKTLAVDNKINTPIYYWRATKIETEVANIGEYCTLLVIDPITKYIPQRYANHLIFGWQITLHKPNRLYRCQF